MALKEGSEAVARKKGKDKPTECTESFIDSGLLRAMHSHYAGKPEGVNKPGHPDYTGKREKDEPKPFHEMNDFEVEERFRKGVSRSLRDAGFRDEDGKKPSHKGHDAAWAEVYKLHHHTLYGSELMNLATNERHLSYLTSPDARKAMMDLVAETLGVVRREPKIEGEDAPDPVPTPRIITGDVLFDGAQREPNNAYATLLRNLQLKLRTTNSETNLPENMMPLDSTRVEHHGAKVVGGTAAQSKPKVSGIPPHEQTVEKYLEWAVKEALKSVKQGADKPLFNTEKLPNDWFKQLASLEYTNTDVQLGSGTNINQNLAYLITVTRWECAHAIARPDNVVGERRIKDYAEQLGEKMVESGLLQKFDRHSADLKKPPRPPRTPGKGDGPDDGKGGGGRTR